MGKAVVIALLLVCLIGGAGIWYTQTRAFWDRVDGPVALAVEGDTFPAASVEAIASRSSPLGFRACFAHTLDVDALDAVPRANPAPTVPPGWFGCFDAEAVAALIASGEAQAFTAFENAAYGVDRVVALAADGRGWAWHELNDCGRRDYAGTPVGDECPDREAFEPLREEGT